MSKTCINELTIKIAVNGYAKQAKAFDEALK